MGIDERRRDHDLLVTGRAGLEARDHTALDRHLQARVDPLDRVEHAPLELDVGAGPRLPDEHHATSRAACTGERAVSRS